MEFNIKKYNSGFAVISSLLVVAAILVLITISTTLLSVSGLTQSLSNYQSEASLNLVESCAEMALLELNKTNSLSPIISLPEGNCSLIVDSNSGSDWLFTVTGEFEKYNQSIQISTNIGSTITINSWQHVQ